MKIQYVKLVNFADIYAGMKTKKVEIDLSKSKNKVVLFLGRNGTGKTALLSKFHPFATPGNMDVRNASELILEGHDGYKEIHIKHGKHTYVVKHFYMYKTGKGMKSYLAKDGEEMNPNGNVTSFKEVVETELSLEHDYLKLLRLGSNVTSFIDMKAAERKNFTSSLLSDIDVYSKLYRKINDDTRMVKSLMKTVSDKIGKLNIYDEQVEQSNLRKLVEELNSLKKQMNALSSDKGGIQRSVELLVPDGVDSFVSDMKETSSEIKRIHGDIDKKNKKMSKFSLIIMGDKNDFFKELTRELSMKESQLASNKNMIEFYFNQVNALEEKKKDYQNNLKYISSELEYTRLTDMYLDLHRKKEKLDKKFKSFTPHCTREEFLTAMGLLQEIQKFVEDIYEYSTNAVQETVNMILDGRPVDTIVGREVSKIDNEMTQLQMRARRADTAKANVNPDAVYVLYKPTGCDCECPFQQFYNDVTGTVSEEEHQTTQDKLKALEEKREFFMSFLDIQKKIDYIFVILKANNKLISKIPENFFSTEHILTCMKTFTPFYDEDYLTNYVTLLEEYEEYQTLDTRIKEVQKEKSFIEKNSTTLKTMQDELAKIDTEIYTISENLDSVRLQNDTLQEDIETLEARSEEFNIYNEIEEELSILHKEQETYEAKYLSLRENHEKLSELRVQEDQVNRNIRLLQGEIDSVESQIESIKFRLHELKTLENERKQLEESYDDISIIKEALSSNKGIPLLFIQLYLRNSRIVVNQLLETVYSGDLEISDFIVNDKEFRIPYVKNGLKVQDVVYCSQGEKSFVSLALSFALIEQSIKDYNILLLDEIDATLDYQNRGLFLSILEKQLESIDAEQVFLITHNNMFDDYGVDVIMTSDVTIDNYRNVNVIYKPAA